MKRLAPSDFTEMPWRNGGGVTQEIAKHEDAQGLLWRISTARVEADGQYSLFPGMTRLSAVVEGKGVTLTDQGGGAALVGPETIAELSGDQLYHGALIDGGIRHLNLVFNPQRIEAEMYFAKGRLDLAPERTHALYCVEGGISAAGEAIGPGEVLFGAGTALIDENSRAVCISLARAP